jgi:hypothetical protein
MKHLSREELIDSLEHTLPPAREAHVDTCHTCRAERTALQHVLGRVKAVDVPEPSPLFWQHFSDRVAAQIAQQPAPDVAGSLWARWTWPRWAVAAATMVVCVTLGWAGLRDYRRTHFVDVPSVTRSAMTHASESAALDGAAEEDWNLVVSMAEDVSIDDADDAAMAVRPGAADRVMSDLSSEQRSELARLLTAEMARPAS